MASTSSSAALSSTPLHIIVGDLVEQTGLSQRDLAGRVGMSKDQFSRTLKGTRHLSLDEAGAILAAAGLPARGTLTLAMFDRRDLANEWSRSGLAAFLETLVAALPDALVAELGDSSDRVDPRWGAAVAKFVAQRIASHIDELIEREQKLGEFRPAGGQRASA